MRSELSDSTARSELEWEIKLQKLLSDDIRNIFDKIKHLSLNDEILNEVSSDRIHGNSDINKDFFVARRFGEIDAKVHLNNKDCLKSANAGEVKLQSETRTPASGERIDHENTNYSSFAVRISIYTNICDLSFLIFCPTRLIISELYILYDLIST